jgi:methylaspartate mutase sigma subunit
MKHIQSEEISPQGAAAAPLRCLVSTIPSDSHTWNLVMLQLLLEEHSQEVANLGPCPPWRLVLDSCRRLSPDLLVVSTVNGHGHLEIPDLIRMLDADEELRRIHLIVGGKLGCGGDDRRTVDSLRAAGADAFTEDEGLEPFVDRVRALALDKGRLSPPAPVG